MNSLPANIWRAFQTTAAAFSSHQAIQYSSVDKDHQLSYEQLAQEAIQFGNFLAKRGIQPRDKVAILLDNGPDFAVTFLALMYRGAVAVPLDTQFDGQQVNSILIHSQAKGLILTSKRYEKIKIHIESFNNILIDDSRTGQELDQTLTAEDPSLELTRNDLAAIFYTSGTTANPKGVMLSQDNLLSNIEAILELQLVNCDDVIISFLPLHHTYAFTTTLLLPLLVGAGIVYLTGMTSVELQRAMSKYKVTIFVGVPQIYALMANSIQSKLKNQTKSKRILLSTLGTLTRGLRKFFMLNLSRKLFWPIHQSFGGRVRYLVSGGAKLDCALAKLFTYWGFTILEGYGLTETAPVVAFNPPARPKIGTVGKPLAGIEVRIADQDESGVGEVIIRGPNVMVGYYENKQETEQVIKDCWFASGDLGYFDNQGYLCLVGRKKEIIVLSSGKKVMPEEVENFYSLNPFIKEIGVLSSQETSHQSGTEKLVSVIVIDEDHFRTCEESNIRRRLTWELDTMNANLPSYKRINGYVVSKEPLPRTRLGKIKRYELEKIYSQLIKGEPTPSSLEEVQEQDALKFESASQVALDFIKQTLNREVRSTDHLELDLGLDSLGRMEILLGLQEKMGLELNDEQAMNFFLCQSIGELLKQLKAAVPEEKREIKEDAGIKWGEMLKENPTQETVQRINLSPGGITIFINFVVVVILKILFKILFLLRIEGKENIPKAGPFLICPNHSTYLDGIFVLCALPFKIILQTYFVGLSQFFEHFTLRPFIRMGRLIPLEMNYNFIEALRACAYVLRYKKIVCYFPEGHRSIDGEIKEFRKGVGILIGELGIPALPVYLDGAFKTWPRKYRFPRVAPVTVHIGKPVFFKDILSDHEQAASSHEVIAKNLRNKLLELAVTNQHCQRK